MTTTKEAAAQAYEKGVALALKDAGLDKTASDKTASDKTASDKTAAAQAYEKGVALALEDAGLNKTAADPGKLQALWAALKGAGGQAKTMAMEHPALAGAAGGGALGAGGAAAGGGDIGDILAALGIGAGAGAGLGIGAKGYAAGRLGKGLQSLG